MAYFLLTFMAFAFMTIGVCSLLQRFIRIDTTDYDVYHLWEEFDRKKEDYHL
ncbi:hypothetical protein [Pseudalkalibacillus berkeleyi]|uniref:Uncharacterized protein n=1 Tax=Pseudalkalibacillus berkeleyi TaxID=1069813 RepID=A0ABS9H2U6_9BACL|nr:hypothetical protein [Pseudalkalibacillus berkeleyi]MCF6138386.1 hypothetical protein [Pseudalkalibacillus berkeleyi]